MRFGAVIFDDVFRKSAAGARKRAGTDGWASIDGGPARRIVSIGELESDVKWWTNFEFTDFNSNFLSRHPNLFFSGFLRTEFKALSNEIGSGVEQLSADQAAQAMSTLFGRVMRLAIATLGINLESGAMGTKKLTDYIAARTPNKNKIPEEANEAFRHAHQAWTSIPTRLPRDWKSATLRRPRYSHALDVLCTAVPPEHRWKYINSDRLPETHQKRMDWCLGNDEMPVLTNVVIKPRRGDFTTLLSYNSGSTVTRSWVCQPELLFLSQFCDIEVVGAFVCEAGFEPQKELDTFPSLGHFSTASLSLGILTENLWMSMAEPRVNAMAQKFYPPRGVWYRATDRIAMFVYAGEMQRAGFQISGYGNGSVLVCYPAGATEELISAATEFGLDVPASKYAEVRTEVRLARDE